MYTILGADGKEYGPVNTGRIHEWIRDGRANLQTKARYEGETAWKPLESFDDFGQQQPKAPPVITAAAPDRAAEKIEINSPPVLPLASPWMRLPAATIDGLFKTLAYLPITIPLFQLVISEAMSGEQRSFAEMSQLTSDSVNTHLPQALPYLGLLMLVQLWLLATRGQSIGKLVLGLRIVRLPDGEAPGVFRAFLLRGTTPFLIEQLPVIGFIFWVVDSCFLFRPDRRCLHDLIAGTVVVKRQ